MGICDADADADCDFDCDLGVVYNEEEICCCGIYIGS